MHTNFMQFNKLNNEQQVTKEICFRANDTVKIFVF